MIPADHAYPAIFLEPQRQLALAECGLGNHGRAAALLDELLAKHGHESNPLFVGLLHQARAEVAERAQDRAAAAAHRAQMENRFQMTQNPLLIAQCERADRDAAAHSSVRAWRERSERVASLAPVQREGAMPANENASDLDVLSASPEPLQALVEYVIQRTRAKNAYLYILAGGELRLAWSTAAEEPHPACLTELARWLEVVRENARNPTTLHDREPLLVQTVSGYRLVALQNASEATTVGGLILEAEPNVDLLGSTHIFDALGHVIEERGLDTLEFITV
jgi:methylmalonyl-CoA mutase cobalamin-binding subunit